MPRCSESDAEGPELMTPEGWGDRSSADEPNWNGSICSELVIPADWASVYSKRTQKI
jgi:hypothetical protein